MYGTRWQPFFNFFIMADTHISFLLIPRKPETQTLEGLVIQNFAVQHIFMKWQQFIFIFS